MVSQQGYKHMGIAYPGDKESDLTDQAEAEERATNGQTTGEKQESIF